MKITLNLTTNLYSTPDDNGKQKIIKKDIRFQKTFDTHAINVSEYITAKGCKSKILCIVIEGDKEYTCVGKFENIKNLISPTVVKGFKL